MNQWYNVSKASLWCVEHDDWSFEFPFNPEGDSLRLDRTVNWEPDATDGAWGGAMVYGQGNPDRLQFTILLDETQAVPPEEADAESWEGHLLSIATALFSSSETNEYSVLDHVKAIYRLSLPVLPSGFTDAYAARPPLVAFVWGDFEFMGMITSVGVQFLLFTPEGVPKRAKIDIEMSGRALSADITSVDAFFEDTYSPKSVSGGSSLSRSGDVDRIALLGSGGEAE